MGKFREKLCMFPKTLRNNLYFSQNEYFFCQNGKTNFLFRQKNPIFFPVICSSVVGVLMPLLIIIYNIYIVGPTYPFQIKNQHYSFKDIRMFQMPNKNVLSVSKAFKKVIFE